MAIIGTLPNTITNGQAVDATPVMADFNWILNQTNANAADKNAANTFVSVQSGVASNVAAGFPITSQIQSNAFTWCGTAGGTANALTLTPSVAITAYVAGQTFIFKSGAASNSGATTVSISGLTTIAIQSNGSACVGGEILANTWYSILVDASNTSCQLSKIGYATLAQLGAAASGAVISSGLTMSTGKLLGRSTAATGAIEEITVGTGLTLSGGTLNGSPNVQIQPISASVATNALTISASSLTLDFRSTTLGSGTVTTVTGTPSNLVVPSTATLGTINAIQSKLVVLALNNAGTIELAVINIAGGNDLTETGVITTTTISATATANNVAYSTTGRTGVAYRVIGYIESTQATAGTWSTAPSTIQGYGGQALAAMSTLGYGQTWQSVVRTSGTTYYNTTGKPILFYLTANVTGSLSVTVNGVAMPDAQASNNANISIVIPPGASYSYTLVGSAQASWELR